MFSAFLGLAIVAICGLAFSVYTLLSTHQLRGQIQLYQDYLGRFREQLVRQENFIKEEQQKRVDLESAFYDVRQESSVFIQEKADFYKQALKMASMGASIEDMMETCGMARSEAELLINLQAYKTFKEHV